MVRNIFRISRLGAFGAVVVGLALGHAIVPDHAGAVPGLVRVVKRSAIDSSTSKTVIARCPAGMRVVGGGSDVVGGGGQVILQRLQPNRTATGDRFVAGAMEDETGFSGDWRLTAIAICSDPLPGQQIASSTLPPTSNGLQSQLAFCGTGQAQIGFGGRIENGAGQVHITDLFDFFGAPNSVTFLRALEDANGYGGSWSVTPYAVCANSAAVIGVTQVSAQAPASSANKSSTVTCPAGTQVHSAGGQLVAGAGAFNSLVIDKVSVDQSLSRVTVRGMEDEVGTGANWSVTATAFCAQ